MQVWHALKRGFAALALVVALLTPFASSALALDFPELTGRVVDEAGILDTTTRVDLIRQLALLEGKSTDQLVVVTLKSLQGTTIEDFGVQLGRHWAIGQKDKNNGVLLIVAPNERKVRIEVGYGLEGTLTDAISKFIIETSILPRFKTGDFPGGIRRGTDDIIQVLTGDAEDWKRRAAPTASGVVSKPGALQQFVELIVGFVALAIFAAIAATFIATIGMVILSIVLGILVALGLIPPRKKRKGNWTYLNWIDNPSKSSGSSSSSSSSSSFSGGGGSFGGGGSSGSW